ncbi:MAG: SAM-dependent methyltransferase, partial [Clostridia bacterium]|nr:SAM-dependent methyltransferase [Clostridia bacterium]
MENSIRSVMEYVCETLAFEKITFSKCRDAATLRASVTPFSRRGEAYVQIETFTADGRALHRNLPSGEAAEVLCEMAERQYKQTNIHTADGDCEIRFSKKEQCSILNRIKPKSGIPTAPAALASHNKKKQYLLDPAQDEGARAFLYRLGITDEGGRILDKKRPKYRQINRFLELVDDIYGTLPAQGTLVIYDLCCGKSYLTFAVYHYFSVIKGREIKMHGVDLKPDVIAYCNETASALGMIALSFSCGDINAYEPPSGETPDLVLSLHACDIATDIVLKNAVRFDAKAVLSTPCCHHEVFHAM